tara:strand:- start:754 stop:1260 length:507 start_codon:yes stop_codon:yes gene_type:complete
MALFNKSQGKTKDDEFYTFGKDWKKIEQYIPKNKIVWEPFSNGAFEGVDYLKSITKELISNTGDFFDNEWPCGAEIVITNPPFSIKKQVLQRLKELDKPFIMILPTLTLQTKYLKNIYGDDIQVIMPTSKIFFYKWINGEKVHYDKLSYYCCYICYKMNLPKDFILLD